MTPKMDQQVQELLLKHYNNDLDRAALVHRELRRVYNRQGSFANIVNWASFKACRDPAEWWEDQDCSRDLKDMAIYALSINPTTGLAERN